MKKLIASLLLVVGLSACNTVTYYPDRVDYFVDLLNSQSAYDSNFYLVKHPNQTATEGFVVVYSDDTGYVAYDIASYIAGDSWYTYSSSAQYQEVYIHETYSSYGEMFYVGYAYDNDFWGSFAGEFVFETTAASFKDLEKVGAIKEAFKQAEVAKTLANEYGLSEGRSVEVAKMVSNWGKLAGQRKLTNSDADAFATGILGVSFTDAQNAVKESLEGNNTSLESLVDTAANANGTSPEHMNALISDIMTK